MLRDDERAVVSAAYTRADTKRLAIMANTKSENIENTSGDPFWEKSEMIFLQSLFYYVIRHYDKRHQNFTEILKLIRLSNPDATGVSELDRLFNKWIASRFL